MKDSTIIVLGLMVVFVIVVAIIFLAPSKTFTTEYNLITRSIDSETTTYYFGNSLIKKESQ
jgi:hypothetical protein